MTKLPFFNKELEVFERNRPSLAKQKPLVDGGITGNQENIQLKY
jgi:hypothetical protein